MKATVGGKLYDTETAEERATFVTYSNTNHYLYESKDGGFFLVLQDCILDGRRLGPLESIEGLAPELFDPWQDMLGGPRKSKAQEQRRQRRQQERHRRIRSEERLVPVTDKEAMTWCVKTQIPDCFKGYLLDCI